MKTITLIQFEENDTQFSGTERNIVVNYDDKTTDIVTFGQLQDSYSFNKSPENREPIINIVNKINSDLFPIILYDTLNNGYGF